MDPMLKLGEAPFTQGRLKFLDHNPKAPEPTAKIFVQFLVADLAPMVVAQLDTGAAWSVLDPEVADLLGLLDLEMDGPLTLLV